MFESETNKRQNKAQGEQVEERSSCWRANEAW